MEYFQNNLPEGINVIPKAQFAKEVKSILEEFDLVSCPPDTMQTLQHAMEGYLTELFKNADLCRVKKNAFTPYNELKALAVQHLYAAVHGMTGEYPERSNNA